MTLFDIAIDVSRNNGDIDWKAVAEDGIKLAMIKATQGSIYVDPSYEVNHDGAILAGLRVIPYHYCDASPVASQIEHFKAVALAPIMALDWEGPQHSTLKPDDVAAFGAALPRALGYWGIRGSSPATPTRAMQAWDLWTPRYRWGDIPNFAAADTLTPAVYMPALPTLRFWQYSSAGQVAGVDGLVDRSVANFETMADFMAWLGPA